MTRPGTPGAGTGAVSSGIARGSAAECAAIVDIAMARRLCPATAGASARTLLVRIVQMLTKLIGRMGR
jgi:hypothetical protein